MRDENNLSKRVKQLAIVCNISLFGVAFCPGAKISGELLVNSDFGNFSAFCNFISQSSLLYGTLQLAKHMGFFEKIRSYNFSNKKIGMIRLTEFLLANLTAAFFSNLAYLNYKDISTVFSIIEAINEHYNIATVYLFLLHITLEPLLLLNKLLTEEESNRFGFSKNENFINRKQALINKAVNLIETRLAALSAEERTIFRFNEKDKARFLQGKTGSFCYEHSVTHFLINTVSILTTAYYVPTIELMFATYRDFMPPIASGILTALAAPIAATFTFKTIKMASDKIAHYLLRDHFNATSNCKYLSLIIGVLAGCFGYVSGTSFMYSWTLSDIAIPFALWIMGNVASSLFFGSHLSEKISSLGTYLKDKISDFYSRNRCFFRQHSPEASVQAEEITLPSRDVLFQLGQYIHQISKTNKESDIDEIAEEIEKLQTQATI